MLPMVAALAGLLVTLAIFYPGVLPRDGVGMYSNVVSGLRSDAKPRLFVDLWWLIDAVICGSGGMFAFQAALYWSAALALATAVASNSLSRLALVLGLGFLPPLFGRLPMVSTDIAVLAAWSLGAGLILHRDLRATVGMRRGALTIAAFTLLAFGTLVRHNAVTGVVPLLWLLVAPLEGDRGRRWWRSCALALVLALLLIFGGRAHNGTAARTYNWADSPLWDLTAISVRSGEMLVPRFLLRDPSAADELRTLERYYTPYSAARLFYLDGGRLVFPKSATEARALLRAWRAAIMAHPREYVWHRSRVASLLLAIDDYPIDILFLENPPQSSEVGRCTGPWRIRFRESPATTAIRDALRGLIRTPLYQTWLWALAGIAAAVGGARLGGMRGRCATAIATSGLCYVAPVLFVAPAAHFRYTLWLYAATAIAIVLLATAILERRRGAEASKSIAPG